MAGQDWFVPGEPVPDTGLYNVVHVRHRVPHKAIVPGGGEFPRCKKCGAGVRFHRIPLYEPNCPELLRDPDFGEERPRPSVPA